MAENLQEEDSFGQDQRLKLLVVGLFFVGLFLLAIGAGIFLFRNSNTSAGDIQIITNEDSPRSGLVVHVDGAVITPGVYEMSAESRVSDAISASGGLSDSADMTRVNLAAKVSDGQKIYIPKVGESTNDSVSSGSVSGQSMSALVNINTASESQLDTLPGIGPATAQKIIASRPYSSPEDLLAKKAVGQSVYEKIKDLIAVF